MEIGILSVIIFLPMIVSFTLLILPFGVYVTKVVSFSISLVVLFLALSIYSDFQPIGTMQFREFFPWIKSYGIHYSLGIDGFSLTILMLIAIIIPCAYLMLWDGDEPKSYWASMLLIQSGICGTLFSLDLILFYFFWEAMLLPVFMIIGLFGSGNRIYSTLKVTVYTMFGSLFMFVCILYLGVSYYYEFGVWSFELSDIVNITSIRDGYRVFLFVGFMLAFAIKIPLFPFHTWLLETYSNAPTGGVFIFSSIMAKLGVYGILRFVLPIFPDIFVLSAPYFVGIGVFGLIYFGIAAIMQYNIKKMFAYSSASHLGFIVAGVFSLNMYGMSGSVFLIVAHAMATGGLFLLVGVMERNMGIKAISALGGIAKKAPFFTVYFAIMMFCIVGLPSTNGFVSELLIILGIFKFNYIVGIVSTLTVLVAASFMLWMFQRAILQDSDNDVSKMVDLGKKEILALFPLSVLIFVMGIYPDWFLAKIEPTIQHYLFDILKVGM
ncbi:MAG: NADH-quinone oxidoreductase subunit M [Sulfurospirillaceae bacterium]|nr:NADH-quinone oxidoreductase subunit M [Sulfurospirillaceae bacterium]